MRQLEFLDRFSDLSLSAKNANKCLICKQLSLLCETITYFTKYLYDIENSSHADFRNLMEVTRYILQVQKLIKVREIA